MNFHDQIKYWPVKMQRCGHRVRSDGTELQTASRTESNAGGGAWSPAGFQNTALLIQHCMHFGHHGHSRGEKGHGHSGSFGIP